MSFTPSRVSTQMAVVVFRGVDDIGSEWVNKEEGYSI
jgi:hypothetical protein